MNLKKTSKTITITFFMIFRAPTVSIKARQFLCGFATSYRCEQTFSIMNVLKSKKRNKLDVKHQVKIKMSTYEPRFDLIVDQSKTRRSNCGGGVKSYW